MASTFMTPNYKGVLEAMIDDIGGLHIEKQTSVDDLATRLTQFTPSSIGLMRKVSERVGGMTVRYEARRVMGSGGHTVVNGKKSFWTFTKSPQAIIDKAMKMWDLTEFTSAEIERKMPKDPRYNAGNGQSTQKKAWTESNGRSTAVVESVTDDETETTQIAEQLRPLRKDDAEALIAAAEQYGQRETFIKEELAKFAAMGIVIDESAIRFERDERLEVVLVVVDHFDRIRRANDRLQAKLTQSGSANYADRLAQLQSENNQLRADMREREAAITGLTNEYRKRLQEADRAIREATETPRQRTA